jgi:hypothetical protein
VFENCPQTSRPRPRERIAISARDHEDGERTVQNPGRFPKAVEVERPNVGEIERHEREEGSARKRQRERSPAKHLQHDGMIRTMEGTRSERPDFVRG